MPPQLPSARWPSACWPGLPLHGSAIRKSSVCVFQGSAGVAFAQVGRGCTVAGIKRGAGSGQRRRQRLSFSWAPVCDWCMCVVKGPKGEGCARRLAQGSGPGPVSPCVFMVQGRLDRHTLVRRLQVYLWCTSGAMGLDSARLVKCNKAFLVYTPAVPIGTKNDVESHVHQECR